MRHCKHCHTCGAEMEMKDMGKEWCPHCKVYRYYMSHGFRNPEDNSEDCPPILEAKYQEARLE